MTAPIPFARMWYALCFYADPTRYDGANHRAVPHDPYTPAESIYRQDVTRDRGHVAREAIESDDATLAYQVLQVQRAAAIVELMQESKREKNTRAAYRRIFKALTILGLTPEEGAPVLRYLEYHDAKGQPWAWLTENETKGKRHGA